jgi:teichoic acid transport system ATP-binding protein
MVHDLLPLPDNAHEPRSDSDRTVVAVEDLTVEYAVMTDRQHSTVRSRVIQGWRSGTMEKVIALKSVSLDLEKGQVLGVIGSNGSGKSTLVRAIAGLHPPAAGKIRVAAKPTLLGVGAVLEPKLSGARNVILGCLALGMTLQEARDAFPDIVAFAGLAHAIDRPMRTYSSGMRARLHFAIATSIDPEILLIDEVLAVGDREFKRRSLKRLAKLSESAGAVMMVTHSLKHVTKIATQALWLHDGEVRAFGEPRDVVKAYKKSG